MPYKAFNKDFTCKGKQYEENTTYEENGSEICEEGVMHYCNNPFDVLNYYPLVNENGDISEFAEVEPLGNVYENKDKCATNKLRIGAKLGLKGFIKACIDFTLKKTKVETTGVDTKRDNRDCSQLAASGDYSQLAASGDYSKLASSGDSSKLAASGDSSKLAASGDSSKLAASGYCSQLAASGDYSQLAASGYCSQLASSGDSSNLAASGYSSNLAASGDSSKLAASGYSSQLASSGDSSKLAASGDYSKLASSGDYSKLAASGDSSQLAAEGIHSVVMAAGHNSIAKAKIGSWITLAEWTKTDEINGKGNRIWIPKCVKTEYVDGERIKEDTFYKLVDGEFKEAED